MKKLLDSNQGMSRWDLELGARHNASDSTSGIVRAMVGLITAEECNDASIGKFHGAWFVQEPAPQTVAVRGAVRTFARSPQ